MARPHRDMEIITWVLSGELEHRDSAGHEGLLYPGLAQRMSAGSGIRHSEMNHSATQPVHLVQMRVVPDMLGIEPSYEQLDVNEQLASGELVPVASGRGHADAINIHQSGAVMYVGRLDEGGVVDMPDAPFVHVFVATGTATLGSDVLREGDSVRLANAGIQTLTALAPSEIIVWESSASTSP